MAQEVTRPPLGRSKYGKPSPRDLDGREALIGLVGAKWPAATMLAFDGDHIGLLVRWPKYEATFERTKYRWRVFMTDRETNRLVASARGASAADVFTALVELVDGPPQPPRPAPNMHLKSGLPVWFEHPEWLEELRLADLSVLNHAVRYSGHAGLSATIAAHSHLVPWLLTEAFGIEDPLTVAFGAVHDLHEAIVGDVHTALKSPAFKAIEEKWEREFRARLGLPEPDGEHKRLVKQADLLALGVETMDMAKNEQVFADHLRPMGFGRERVWEIAVKWSDRILTSPDHLSAVGEYVVAAGGTWPQGAANVIRSP